MLLLSFKDICVVLCLFVCQFPALFSLAPTGDFFCFGLTRKKLWIKNTFPKRRKDADNLFSLIGRNFFDIIFTEFRITVQRGIIYYIQNIVVCFKQVGLSAHCLSFLIVFVLCLLNNLFLIFVKLFIRLFPCIINKKNNFSACIFGSGRLNFTGLIIFIHIINLHLWFILHLFATPR